MICAIVLAAGQSRRMGTQKVLLPVQGKSLIARVADEALASRVSHTLVVVGRDADSIRKELADRPVQFVQNPEPESEMLASVRCGLRELPEGCTGVAIVLGDQPGIKAELIDQLMQTFDVSGRGIVVPVCAGKRGHPLVFKTRYRDEILERFDETGLRGLLQAHPEDVYELEIAEPEVFEDLDEPQDYERMNRRLGIFSAVPPTSTPTE